MSSGREEGEIDSEEDGLRKRINELEEENAEYEKIKRISECYADKYGNMYRLNEYSDWEAVQRAGQVPTDASSISSVEFPTPKKKKHKRNKKTKCKRLQQRSHRCGHQRHKHCKSQLHGEKRHHHRRDRLLNPYYQNHRIETISLDTSDNSEYEKDNYSIATMEIESADEDDGGNITLPLSREELRLACGRGAAERKNNICSLKERLQPDKCIELSTNGEHAQAFAESTPNSNDVDNVVEINSDNSISTEEQELRLIALRSAIMRKHATRKKRNAEVAYSPTDFDDLLVEPVSPVASEIEELEGDMEISPASSPILFFSPIQCDDEQNSNLSLETIENQVDNKPVDMDIVSSDSEQEESAANAIDPDDIYAQPTHDIPLPAGAPMESMGMPMSTYNYANHAKPMPYDMYMPPMHFGAQSNMPPAMLPMPTPTATTTMLPPCTLPDCVVEESCIKSEELRMSAESPKSANMDIIAEGTPDQAEQCSDEEEADALRALLLSQHRAAKAPRANGLLRMRKASPAAPDIPPQIATAQAKELASIIKPQPIVAAPLVQSGVHSESGVTATPTESILKEAVRRFKVKSFAGCEENDSLDAQQQAHVPRLKIKAFARCKEFDEDAAAHAQPPSAIEHEGSAFVMHPTHVNGINYELMQQEESRSSYESNSRLSAPEILGMQTHCNESAVALLAATKRRLEPEAPMGRTLRTIELQHRAENCSSQHSAEDSNSNGVVDKSKTQQNFETQAKKLKTSMTDGVQAAKAVANSVSAKERAQESNAKERDGNASGEKENKEVTSAIASGNESATNTAVKAKSTAKPLGKFAKVSAEKRKISAIAAATKTTNTATAKQPALKAVPSKSSTAPKAPPKLLKPQAHQLKIVKPNKVINKSLEKSEDVGAQKKLVEASNQSRILTPTTLPNIKVKKLVIRLGASDSSSEDEEILRNHTLERCIGLATARTATPDSLTGVLNENVYLGKDAAAAAAAAALSNLSAAPLAETRVQTNDDISNTSSAIESIVGESFEKKLENFLKNMRSKTVQRSGDDVAQPRLRRISANSAQTGTPTAVRSLPIASQDEYKRLVHRMKILEKQKHLKKKAKSLLEDAEKYTKTKQGNANLLPKANNARNLVDVAATASTDTQTCNDASRVANEKVATTIESVAQQPACEDEHSKQVPTATKSAENIDAQTPTTEVPPKNERALTMKLHSCEKVLASISNNIITRLDKSLQLVNEAKAAKIAKMRHEQRLKELRLEMEQTQRKMKEEQVKLARKHPEICANNELITKLKQKRTKLQEMAVKLGSSIKGEDYRLNNDLKNEITLKTKGLATHIKLVNSIRYCDLDVLEKAAATLSDNSCPQKTNDAVTTDSQQAHAEVAKNLVPSTNAAGACENIENTPKALPSNEANVHETINCAEAENNSSAVCENAAVSQVIAQQVSENCDKAKEEVVLVVPATPAVACVEELPTPCENGKEVLRPEEEAAEEDSTLDVTNVTAAAEEQANTRQSMRYYVSPLAHLRSESGKWNPNDIICPYELMGQCEDKDCSYRHLTDK